MRVILPFLVLCAGVACGGALPPLENGTLLRDQGLEHGGVSRTYHLYTSDEPGPRPLVVALHGGGSTIDGVVGITTGAAPFGGMWLTVADAEGFHVAVPQGLEQHWNDCRADCEHCPESDDGAFLLALVDAVAARVDVDPARVFVAGESNGGFMAQRMALEHGDRIAGAGVVNAGFAADSECVDVGGSVPIVHVLGTADTTIPWDGGPSSSAGSGSVLGSDEAMAGWAARNACDGEPTRTVLPDLDPDDGSTVTEESWGCGALARYVVDGGGHVPPSVDQPVSTSWERLVGEQNHDLETVRAMWAFFTAR